MSLASGRSRPLSVVWPRTPQGFRALVLSEGITGTYTHFDHTTFTSTLCMQTEDCVFCRMGWIVRWKGFVATLIAAGQPAIVELSELAALQVLKACSPEQSARGLDLHLRREDKRVNSAVLVEVYQRLDPSAIVAAFDVVGPVQRMFGGKAVPWMRSPAELYRVYYRYDELALGARKDGV